MGVHKRRVGSDPQHGVRSRDPVRRASATKLREEQPTGVDCGTHYAADYAARAGVADGSPAWWSNLIGRMRSADAIGRASDALCGW
jgi:hypothetical protein